MQLNLKMLEDKVKKVEAEVVDLREVIRKAIPRRLIWMSWPPQLLVMLLQKKIARRYS